MQLFSHIGYDSPPFLEPCRQGFDHMPVYHKQLWPNRILGRELIKIVGV